jgi:hypothetical protein
MSEEGSKSDIKPSRFNVAEVPQADPSCGSADISSRGLSNAFRPENMAEIMPPPSCSSVITTPAIWQYCDEKGVEVPVVDGREH